MNSPTPSYHGYRFPADIIAHAVWLYFRFNLSFRDVEDLLAQRGITVTCETIRQWCGTFGHAYGRRLRQRRGRLGDTWHLDELSVSINGRQQYRSGSFYAGPPARFNGAAGAPAVSGPQHLR